MPLLLASRLETGNFINMLGLRKIHYDMEGKRGC